MAKNFLNESFPDKLVLDGDDDSARATDSLVRILVETAEKEFLQPRQGEPRHSNSNATAKTTTFPWNVTVVENPTVNAFCAPGGSVVVFSGLIDFCVQLERENKVDSAASAMCGVLAHEISHGVLRHGMETLSWMPPLMIAMVLTQAFFVSMGFGPEEVRLLNSAFQEVVQFFLRLPHSRRVESEADLLGSELLEKAGLPLDDYPRVLSLLQSGHSEWFSTHPAPEKRALAIEMHLRNNKEATTMTSLKTSPWRDVLEDARRRYARFSERPEREKEARLGASGEDKEKMIAWRPAITN